MGNYSSYNFSGEGVDENMDPVTIDERVNYNFGLRAGYGISGRMDLKLRHERMLPVLEADRELLNGINYFSLTPRYSIIREHLALLFGILYLSRTSLIM